MPMPAKLKFNIDSLTRQEVTLKALDLTVTFEAGEALLSEISRKFKNQRFGSGTGGCGLEFHPGFYR